MGTMFWHTTLQNSRAIFMVIVFMVTVSMVIVWVCFQWCISDIPTLQDKGRQWICHHSTCHLLMFHCGLSHSLNLLAAFSSTMPLSSFCPLAVSPSTSSDATLSRSRDYRQRQRKWVHDCVRTYVHTYIRTCICVHRQEKICNSTPTHSPLSGETGVSQMRFSWWRSTQDSVLL